MQAIRRVLTIPMKMIATSSSSKLSLFVTSLSDVLAFLLTISLSIFSSIFLSFLSSTSLILFNKSVPRTLVTTLFFVNTIYLLALCGDSFVDAQLIINLKNRGGEVFQQAISANTSEDVIEVEYQNTDGSLVTQLIDFRNNLVLFRLILLNEQDILGDSQQKYQRLCYVTLLNRSDFISSDDISKLRQRNPSAIREPETDRGKETVHMNLKLNVNESKQLSGHINRLCTAVGQENLQIYTRYEDLISLAPGLRDDLDDEYDEEDDKKDGLKDERRDELKDKDLYLKNDEFRDENSIDKTSDVKYTTGNQNRKRTGDDLIEQNMNNRCFMQKFRPTIVPANKIDDSISNYEKLKIRLSKQMMGKAGRRDLKADFDDKHDHSPTAPISESSLTPKSLDDFSSYWQKSRKYLNNDRKPTKLLDLFQHPRLQSSTNTERPIKPSSCYCKIEICIPWYPCQVKYCARQSDDKTPIESTLKSTSTADPSRSDRVRCGIRSCKKCWLFYYQVDSKHHCLWDE